MSPKEKAIVLLSGGLDSSVALAEAAEKYEIALALTFNYGQRAFGKELRASKRIAEHFRVPHLIIPLPWLAEVLPKPLQIRRGGLDPEIPTEWEVENRTEETFFDAKPVWVPNRNGLFLNIAAVYAEHYNAPTVVFGANAEEGERFPDNTEAFRDALNQSFSFSTLNQLKVVCPVGHLNKPQIVERGLKLGVPLQLVWSCYGDGETQCGTCPSCYRLKHAIESSSQAPKLKQSLAFSH